MWRSLRYLVACILICVCMQTIAQDRYDSLHREVIIEKLLANPNYYNGEQINLSPRNEDEEYLYYFYTDNSVPIHVDTIFINPRAEQKPKHKLTRKDIRIDTVFTSMYKPYLVKEKTGVKVVTQSSDINNKIFSIISSYSVDGEIWMSVIDEGGAILKFSINKVKQLYDLELPAYYARLEDLYAKRYVGKTFYAQDVYIEGENEKLMTYSAARYSKNLNNRFPASLGSLAYAGAVGILHCVDVVKVDNSLCLVLEIEAKGKTELILAFDSVVEDPTSVLLDYRKKDSRLLMIEDLVPSFAWEEKQYEYNLGYKNKKTKLLQQKYGQQFGEIISNKQVAIGMTKEMCIESWGEPSHVSESVYAWGLFEQWVYGNAKYLLHFKDGVLINITTLSD